MTHRPPFDVLMVERQDAEADRTRDALLAAKPEGLAHLIRVDNGQECLRFLRHEGAFAGATTPAVVLVNAEALNDVEGGILQAIKTDTDLRRIPVVVFDQAADADVNQFYAAGANSVIQKPVEAEKLAEVMRTLANYWFNVVKLPG